MDRPHLASLGFPTEKFMSNASIASTLGSGTSSRSTGPYSMSTAPLRHVSSRGNGLSEATFLDILNAVEEDHQSSQASVWDNARYLCDLLRLDWAVRLYNRRARASALTRARTLWLKFLVVLWLIVSCAIVVHLPRLVPEMFGGIIEAAAGRRIRVMLLACFWVVLSSVLVLLYFLGERTCVMVGFAAMWTLWIIADCTVSKGAHPYLNFILVLDHVVILTKRDNDGAIMRCAGVVVLVVYFVYMALRCYVEQMELQGESTWTIFLFEDEMEDMWWPSTWLTSTLPVLFNYVLMQSYAATAQEDAAALSQSVELAHAVAEKLAKYDLKAAEALLDTGGLWSSDCRVSKEMVRPFKQLLRNLTGYRAFLPESLFVKEVAISPGSVSPSPLLKNAMDSQRASWVVAESCVANLREPSYSLSAFQADVEKAFPELHLYTAAAGSCRKMSSGRDCNEELERTMGALYSVYSIVRLDIDGKEVLSFGVDDRGKPLAEPRGENAEAKKAFASAMPWSSLWELFVRAELLREEGGQVVVNKERMMGFLVLTVVHDVMKNVELLPTVQGRHSPYRGVQEGQKILDHDMALAYIMEKFPWMLPSYRELAPAQRAPILFTQGTMNFNNGWLVQGEAPPGLLFSTFKEVIAQGRASEADVAFYFAHWLTDLAGAEPFNKAPWPGAEKFTSKFPLRVLHSFLDSFSFVDYLVDSSEVEVMETYLNSRWVKLELGLGLQPDLRIAAMRVALMAQGFEKEAVEALACLRDEERTVLEVELARTGCRQQFQQAPEVLKGLGMGPAICVYYSPALLQQAGPTDIYHALQVLAAIFRAARELSPLNVRDARQTAIIRIDSMKALTPKVIQKRAPWVLELASRQDAQVVRVDDDLDEQRAQVPAARQPSLLKGAVAQCASVASEEELESFKWPSLDESARARKVVIKLGEFYSTWEHGELSGL